MAKKLPQNRKPLGNIEISDNPNFLMRVMSDKRNPGQPTIHVGYADSDLTDNLCIRNLLRRC